MSTATVSAGSLLAVAGFVGVVLTAVQFSRWRAPAWFARMLIVFLLLLGAAALALALGDSDDNPKSAGHVPPRGPGKATPTNPTVPTVPTETSPPVSSGGFDGLSKLVGENHVPDLYEGSEGGYGSPEIAGNAYDDGVTLAVFPDSPENTPQVAHLPLTLGRHYDRLTAVVGIDGAANCQDNEAEVAVTRPEGDILWGPRTVGIDDLEQVSASVHGLNRVMLAQRTLAPDDDDCNGEADVAWGRVRLHPARTDG